MKKTLQYGGLIGVIAGLLVLGIGVGVMNIDRCANAGIWLFVGSAILKTIGHSLRGK